MKTVNLVLTNYCANHDQTATSIHMLYVLNHSTTRRQFTYDASHLIKAINQYDW